MIMHQSNQATMGVPPRRQHHPIFRLFTLLLAAASTSGTASTASTAAPDALEPWSHHHGALGVVRITTFAPPGERHRRRRGLAATVDVAPDALVLSIPRRLAIEASSSDPRIAPLVDAADLPEGVKLAVNLMYERYLGAASWWYPYIRGLPAGPTASTCCIVDDMSEADLAWLQCRDGGRAGGGTGDDAGSGARSRPHSMVGCLILDESDTSRRRIGEWSALLQEDLFGPYPDAFPPASAAFTLERFAWACAVIQSRAFSYHVRRAVGDGCDASAAAGDEEERTTGILPAIGDGSSGSSGSTRGVPGGTSQGGSSRLCSMETLTKTVLIPLGDMFNHRDPANHAESHGVEDHPSVGCHPHPGDSSSVRSSSSCSSSGTTTTSSTTMDSSASSVSPEPSLLGPRRQNAMEYNAATDTFDFRSDQAFRRGQELFISYGARRSNAQLVFNCTFTNNCVRTTILTTSALATATPATPIVAQNMPGHAWSQSPISNARSRCHSPPMLSPS